MNDPFLPEWAVLLGLVGFLMMAASLGLFVLLVAAMFLRDHNKRHPVADRAPAADERCAVTVLRPRSGNVIPFPCERPRRVARPVDRGPRSTA